MDAVTALERALRQSAPTRSTPLDALAAARRMWLAEQRVDMGALAIGLGISRATLYNWVGDRERLTGEVLWSMAEMTLAEARRRARGRGARYIAEVNQRYLQAVAGFAPLRSFITRDPEFALRVLTSNRSSFQQHFIDAVREIIEQQMIGGGYCPALDPETMAYLLVRIGESFLYSDVITGRDPDVSKAVEASRVLLNAPPVVRRR